MIYLGIELQLPHFRRRSLEGGDGVVGGYIKDSDEAVNGGGGGDSAGGMGGDGDDPEAMSGVGLQLLRAVGVPQPHRLIKGARQQQRTGILRRRHPRRRPYGVVVSVLHGVEWR